MSQPAPRRSSPPPGTIDFELTDIEDARAALDVLPPGIETLGRLKPGYWEEHRRKPLASDRALTGDALSWLMKLPPALRPHKVCERFPRIANSISEVWDDNQGSLELFERLLNDRRTGRRGFPADVQREIEQLCAHRMASMR